MPDIVIDPGEPIRYLQSNKGCKTHLNAKHN